MLYVVSYNFIYKVDIIFDFLLYIRIFFFEELYLINVYDVEFLKLEKGKNKLRFILGYIIIKILKK